MASLVPAATDLLLTMGAADHLVAVSNYDVEREGIRGLPRVGDYHNTDWEKLSVLRPDVMITQLSDDKLPPGFRKRADDLGIRLVNIHIDRLEEIFATLKVVGEACAEPAKAQQLESKLRGQLTAVRQRVASESPVPALIVLDENAHAIVGPRNFLDDLLEVAGGVNLGNTMGKDYPSIDREKLLELNPQAVIQLLPEAQPQVVAQAQRFWEKIPQLPAVGSSRIHVLTDWYILLPGSHVGTLAEQFADALHPHLRQAGGGAAAESSTRPSAATHPATVEASSTAGEAKP